MRNKDDLYELKRKDPRFFSEICTTISSDNNNLSSIMMYYPEVKTNGCMVNIGILNSRCPSGQDIAHYYIESFLCNMPEGHEYRKVSTLAKIIRKSCNPGLASKMGAWISGVKVTKNNYPVEPPRVESSFDTVVSSEKNVEQMLKTIPKIENCLEYIDGNYSTTRTDRLKIYLDDLVINGVSTEQINNFDSEVKKCYTKASRNITKVKESILTKQDEIETLRKKILEKEQEIMEQKREQKTNEEDFKKELTNKIETWIVNTFKSSV